MPFCSNCGNKLNDGANFCDRCGTKVFEVNNKEEKRKTVNDGLIHKCPCCGEVLNSFVSICPSCQYEIRDSGNSNAIKNFANRLNECRNEAQMINIIRTFPVPNNKEDLLEFLLISKSNIIKCDKNGDGFLSDEENELLNAWLTKVNQCINKAKITFKNSSDKMIFEASNDEIEKLVCDFKKREKERKRELLASKHFKKSPIILVLMISAAVFTTVQLVFALVWINPLMIVLSVAQTILLLSALLNGFGVLRLKFNYLYYFLIVACLLLSLLNVISCDGQSIIWDKILLSEQLPEPDADNGYIKVNSTRELSIELICEENEFKEYIILCEQDGYSIDILEGLNYFKAFNSEGYKLVIDYSNGKMLINLFVPLEFYEIAWPKSKLANSIPIPSSTQGKIISDTDDIFEIYIANLDKNQYVKYVDSVYSSGYDNYYSRQDTIFTGKNDDAYTITVSYEGFNTIYIKIENIKEISITFSDDDLEGKDYNVVLEMLKEAGFTNIELKSKELVYENLYFDGEVDYVSINGERYYSKNEKFLKDCKIIIYYYSL